MNNLMIRFCDKEINFISIDSANRSELVDRFLNEHSQKELYIVDDSGVYIGKITYESLSKSINMEECIQTEKVILDKSIWENAREFFFFSRRSKNEIAMLPVINGEGRLICFAYQDEEANREIRLLRELMEREDVLNFRDVFPDYEYVTIYECNELAYMFALYLKQIGVYVNVRGNYWKEFEEWNNYDIVNCQNLNIYAEGTWGCKNKGG